MTFWDVVDTLSKILPIILMMLYIISNIQRIIYRRRERAMAEQLAHLIKQAENLSDTKL